MKNSFTDFSNNTYIIGVIFAVILFMSMAEAFLRLYVIPNDRISQITVSIYESEQRNVIIGDSQFQYGFRSKPPGYEVLSVNGMPVEAMHIILREYYRHRKPGKIIIIAGPQMLAANRVERGDWGFSEYFKLNAINPPFMLYVFEKAVSRNLAHISKWIDVRQKETLNEHFWEEIEVEKRKEMTKERINIQRPVDHFRKTENFKSYYALLSLLKEKHAEVCLLRMPVSVEYRDLIRNDRAFLEYDMAFKEMAELYEVTYVDFNQLSLLWDASYFINADHLNEKGSNLFVPLAEASCFHG